MKRKTNFYRNSHPDELSGSGKKYRIVLIVIFMLIAFAALITRLVSLQVIYHSHFKEMAENNKDRRLDVAAQRGTIYDRRGDELARDIIHYTVGIGKKYTSNIDAVVKIVSAELQIPERAIIRKINKDPGYARIADRVPAEKVQKIKLLHDPGIVLERKLLRVYPYSENGAHLLGFCDVDNQPLGGVEYQYDSFLRGRPGWKIYLKDALGNELPDLNIPGEEPIDGFDVTLTIDMDYQMILEDELQAAVEKSHAVNGVAILMEPNTGEILAMANYPQFDPNHASDYQDYQRTNRAISDVIEPGSTFKIIPLSAALENLDVNLDKSIYFCENGKFRLFGQTIYDHKKYSWLTLRKVIENSSNIGTMKFSQALSKRVLYRYARNFGFGMITGIDLPGESTGILHPVGEFSKTTQFYMSIGYEIGVTPLQLLCAYSAIANNGELMHPYIMKTVQNRDGSILKETRPEVIRKVLSPETCQLIKKVLVGVVDHGTGVNAAVDGIQVAGKTGTAQIYDPKTGMYDSRKHLASFAGFFPAENPRFSLLVVIRQPRGLYYGGLVAAPAFANMAKRISSLAFITLPEYAETEPVEAKPASYVPRMENLSVKTAQALLSEKGYEVSVVGKGPQVLRQDVITTDDGSRKISLITSDTTSARQFEMPSVKGLTLKEALVKLQDLKVNCSIEGHGVVVRQLPRAGTKINENNTIKLVCKPA